MQKCPAFTPDVLSVVLKCQREEETKRKYSANLAWQLNAVLYRALYKANYSAPMYDDLFRTAGKDKRSGKEIVNDFAERLTNRGRINEQHTRNANSD